MTIRSRLVAGAAIAIYGRRGGQLVEIDATEPIGTPNRWLNIAGIADFTGDGRAVIALVKTPHIGGCLEIWTSVRGLSSASDSQKVSPTTLLAPPISASAIADANDDAAVLTKRD